MVLVLVLGVLMVLGLIRCGCFGFRTIWCLFECVGGLIAIFCGGRLFGVVS